MSNPVSRLFDRFSAKSRAKKMGLLRERVGFTGGERVLDLGSEVGGKIKQLIEVYPDKGNIVAVNLDPEQTDRVKREYPEITTQVADARNLPFPDKHFDLVFSNAVIEHVGDLADQEAMAREVQRVGKSWFITTPNRWYPFEFHARVPFVSWLPRKAMRMACRLCAYNHVKGRYMSGLDFGGIRLLTAREMRRLFPDSEIVKCRITFWPETLIAIGGEVAAR